MPNTTDEEALICAERIRAEIEALALENHDTDRGILTVSLGLTSSVAGDWQVMLKKADKALYQAKSEGRNAVILV